MKKVIQGGDAVKLYSSRDGATAALRKLGIKASDYPMFIFQTGDGRYAASIERAAEFLASQLRNVASEVTPQRRNRGRNAAEAESNQVKRPSVASVIRKLILDGLDNKAIHEAMKRDFGHDESKAHYASWYRSKMKSEGLLPSSSKQPKPLKPGTRRTGSRNTRLTRAAR